MKAYISVSYSLKNELSAELEAIAATLQSFRITPFIFCNEYTFAAEQEKEMMLQALQEIDNCEILLAETSDKAIGIGIEAGYAKAKGKPIIYLRHQTAAPSTTLAGISDYMVIYADVSDLQQQLQVILRQLF
ncbi:MAG: hypothetical protein HYX40_11310 [Sphingobacteriales bacterium]|nr:hypothetical protein [Sphingobacteriales bacterium]